MAICPVIARALARGNAAIKPRAESSSLELCRGGAGSTEGQSSFALCHPECNEGSPTRLPFLTPHLVGFEEILHFVQNDILVTIVRCAFTAVDPHVALLLGMTFYTFRHCEVDRRSIYRGYRSDQRPIPKISQITSNKSGDYNVMSAPLFPAVHSGSSLTVNWISSPTERLRLKL